MLCFVLIVRCWFSLWFWSDRLCILDWCFECFAFSIEWTRWVSERTIYCNCNLFLIIGGRRLRYDLVLKLQGTLFGTDLTDVWFYVMLWSRARWSGKYDCCWRITWVVLYGLFPFLVTISSREEIEISSFTWSVCALCLRFMSVADNLSFMMMFRLRCSYMNHIHGNLCILQWFKKNVTF